VCNVPYLGISPLVLRHFRDIPGRKNSDYIKTFLDANSHRQKSVHRDFSNAILERKMCLEKQHYKVHTYKIWRADSSCTLVTHLK